MNVTRRTLLHIGMLGLGGLAAACGGAPAAPTAAPAKPTTAPAVPAATTAPAPTATAPAPAATAAPVATTAPAAGATTAPAKPAAAPTVAASTKVQLQNARLIWWTNDGKVGDRIKPVYGEWMKANPSVQVEDLVIASGELAPKLATAAAANTLPDLYYARTFTTADHAIRGWLTDITDVVKRDTAEVNVDDLEPLMTIKERWQDKWYSMPENFSVMVVYYNKKVFDELKVAYPKATWTWEEFLDTAKKLVQTDGAGKQTRWGTDFFLANWITWGYLLGNGGQVLSQDLRKSMINSKENADTLQFFGDLIHVHKVSPSPTQLPRGIHPFGNGLVGMHIGGSWEIPVLREAVGDKFDWDVTALPVGKSGKYGVNVEGGCYGVGGSTRYKEEAWQLLKYSTSPKGIQQMVNSILFSLPGRVSTRANWVEVATTGNKPPKGATVFFDMLKNVPPMVPALPYYEEFSRTFDNRVAAIVSGEKKAAEILPPLDDELNAIIAKTKF